MTGIQMQRDYGMLGQDAKLAEAAGLKSAEWYHSEVSRQAMKELMKRVDGPAIRDTIVWLGAMVIFAAWAIWIWPSWWASACSAADAFSAARRSFAGGIVFPRCSSAGQWRCPSWA